MGGGSLQLSAIGKENNYLTINPQISFFKAVYKKYSNFAMQSIRINFDTIDKLHNQYKDYLFLDPNNLSLWNKNDKDVEKMNYLKELLSETNTSLDQDAFNVIFNNKDIKKVNLDASKGLVKGSAVNFYGTDITEADVDDFYSKIKVPNSKKPISPSVA